ncbi:MAG: serine/threonine-protein phosphatase [Clostridiales bacterium]|nr:serine/threonine-protein phosphatase [Clostridiales bacterium]
MRYFAAALTDTGIARNINQDSLCLKIAETEEAGQIVMAVICDGMGGLAKGELASAEVIRAFSKWFHEELPTKTGYTMEQISRVLNHLAMEMNEKIMDYGKLIRDELGTTLTVLLIMRDEYLILHVGDTRVYEIRDTVTQLTEDQTYVAREIKSGIMTVEQAKTDRRRNALLQCIGASERVIPEILFGEVTPGTIYMLCSDGLRHEAGEDEIYRALQPDMLDDTESMEKGGRGLIELVKGRGEKDNISLITVKATA